MARTESIERKYLRSLYGSTKTWVAKVNSMEDNQVFAIYQEHRLRLTDHYNRISQQTGLTVRTVRDLFDNNYIFRQEINKPDAWIKDGWGERTET